MAKQWKPSQKALSRYDELVKQTNKLRRQILSRRRKAEQETPVGRLPALILPEKATPSSRLDWRTIKNKIFYDKMRQMSKVVTGGIEGWYKRRYKRNILEAWRNALDSIAYEKYGKSPLIFDVNGNIKVDSPTGLFTKEMLAQYPELEKYFKTYNKLRNMPIGEFMYMYDNGYMPAFKYIYNEMQGSFMGNYLDEMLDSIDRFRKFVPKDYVSLKPLSKIKYNRKETSIQKARRVKHNRLVRSQQRALKKRTS